VKRSGEGEQLTASFLSERLVRTLKMYDQIEDEVLPRGKRLYLLKNIK